MPNTPIPDLSMPDWAEVGSILIEEAHEPLRPTSLAPAPICTYPAYFKMGVPGAVPECYLRDQAYLRLLQAAQALPEGMRLVVLDGWRPYAVQQYLFDTLIDLLLKKYPSWPQSRLLAKARELVSPPSCDDRSPSPHLTGGAVDVALCDPQGRLLNMGSEFDEASPKSYSAYYEGIDPITPEQGLVRDNRRLLYNVMTAAGFSNLPSEWWHYDFGDQLWAWYHEQSEARYGVARVYSLRSLWAQQLE